MLVQHVATGVPRVRGEKGQYETVYTDWDILDFLDTEGFAGTQEVAEELNCDRSHAHRRLSALQEKEWVNSRKIGGSRVWTLSDAESKQAQATGNSSYIEPRNRDHLNDGENA
jgi:DNA-binding MarR family transcriptional regulator